MSDSKPTRDPIDTQAFSARSDGLFPPWVVGEDGAWDRVEPGRGWTFWSVLASLVSFGVALLVGLVWSVWQCGRIGGYW